jgi:hypothetical protein
MRPKYHAISKYPGKAGGFIINHKVKTTGFSRSALPSSVEGPLSGIANVAFVSVAALGERLLSGN